MADLFILCASQRDGHDYMRQHGLHPKECVIVTDRPEVMRGQPRGFEFVIVSLPTLAVWAMAAERGTCTKDLTNVR